MAIYADNIVKFAGENMSVYESFRDYFNHYKAQNYGSKVTFDTSKDLVQKEEAINKALFSEIERVSQVSNVGNLPMASFAMNPNVIWATFAVIGAMVDMVLPETVIEDTGLYTDVRVGDWGDSFSFDVQPRDLFLVSKHGRGRRKVESTKQFKGQVNVIPEAREITVQVSLYRVLAGKESLAEFAIKAIRSLETQMAYDCYVAFNTAMNNLPTTPTNTSLKVTGAFNQNTLVELAQKVSAWNGGMRPIIVGTKTALSKAVPANSNYRYDIESNYVKVGYLQTISGYDTLELPQVADWENPFATLLDDDKLYIIAPQSKPVKLCLEGNTLSNTTQHFDNANLQSDTTMIKSWGTAVATSAVAGLYVLQ